MTVNPSGELMLFAVFVVGGATAGAVFSLLRAAVSCLGSRSRLTGTFDLIFWMIITAGCAWLLFCADSMPLRWYEPAAMILGGILYFLTIGRGLQMIFEKIINILCKFIRLILKILLTPAAFLYKILIGIFFKPMKKIFGKIKDLKSRLYKHIERKANGKRKQKARSGKDRRSKRTVSKNSKIHIGPQKGY